MSQVNILEAESNLSQLIRLIESHAEDFVTIARDGKPVARLVPIPEKEQSTDFFGIAKGELDCTDDIDWCNEEIAEMFGAK